MYVLENVGSPSILFSLSPYGKRSRAQERTTDLHAIPDAGTGEGIPLQSLPDEKTTDRDRTRPMPHRATNKNLVPKQADEVEEGEQGQAGRRMFGGTLGRARSGHAAIKMLGHFVVFPVHCLRSQNNCST